MKEADERDIEIERLKDELERAQHEVDEVLESTRDIEAQLEQDVALTEKQLQGMKRRNEDLSRDLNEWKERYSKGQKEHEKEMSSLKKELDALTKTYTHVREQLRDEELKHDDLERQERIVTTSYQDLENKYHEALEKNADLESEVAEKLVLQVECQRLKDEIRDLKSELAMTYKAIRPQSSGADKGARSEHASPHSDLDQTSNKKQTYFIKASSPGIPKPVSSSGTHERPPSRLATSNSVKNIQSLSTTIAALREKMRAARETPSSLPRPQSNSKKLSTLPVPLKSLARTERSASAASSRPPSELGHRPPSSLETRLSLRDVPPPQVRKKAVSASHEPPIAPPAKNTRARAHSNLTRAQGRESYGSFGSSSPTPGRRVSLIPSPAGKYPTSSLSTPSKSGVRRKSSIPTALSTKTA